MDGTQRGAVGGAERARQQPGADHEARGGEQPGPDPVHPEASRPVAGKTPEELRKREERRMERGRAAARRTPGR
ncbi:hypothetical protein [Streptomyces sp. NRRL S-87]|uniref:hypothetical protein n=1 Tax=Streptomyces sp. NRRL S-87 TaxID=1463920 RepID=UPI0004BEB100|nr:hypothetical protein [Streptomyces sp. NRRL S-87]